MTQLSHALAEKIQRLCKKNTMLMHNDTYSLRGVYVRKMQIQMFMQMSRYQLNKYIIPPPLRDAMNLTPQQYKYLHAFSPSQFEILREAHKWSDEEVRDMLTF